MLNFDAVEVICEDCGNKFLVTQSILNQRRYTCDGELLSIISFDCPLCEREHLVQVDTDYSKKLLDNCKNDMIIVSKQRQDGGTPKKKDVKRFEKARKKLTKERNRLMKMYQGKLAVNVDTKQPKLLMFSSL